MVIVVRGDVMKYIISVLFMFPHKFTGALLLTTNNGNVNNATSSKMSCRN